ncbi:hypothetical protein D3C74_208340 [compost metagenome]
MNVTLIGYRNLNFITDANEKIVGTQVYVSYLTTGVIGEEAAKYFLNSDFELPNLVVGQSYDMQFNHRGKVIDMLETD